MVYESILSFRLTPICEEWKKMDILKIISEPCINVDYYEGAYYGTVQNNYLDGFGTYIKNNWVYIGQWKNNMRHGHGRQISLKTGNWYEGEWKNNIPDGYGIFVDNINTIVLNGNWINGKFVEQMNYSNFVDSLEFDSRGLLMYN